MTSYVPLVVGGYALASYYFLKNPLVLHKRKSFQYVKFIAHRGGAAEGYENTIQAYKRAVDLGSQMLELDVHLSKDGQAVVVHDNNLKRLTGENLKVNQVHFDDLPLLKPKVPIDFLPGETFSDLSVSDKERKFPTLESVIKEFPNTQINIDIKEKNMKLIQEVNRIICEYKAEDRCVWGSFSGETTSLCYRTNPSIGLLFSAPRILLLVFLFYSGLLPFIPLRETHLEIPMLSIFLSPSFASDECVVSFGKLPRVLLRVCDWLLMRHSLIAHLNHRGIPTYFWVLNTTDQFARAFQLGAAGVMTDRPSDLKTFCNTHNNS